MTDEEITKAILSVDANDELSKDMVEQVLGKSFFLKLKISKKSWVTKHVELMSQTVAKRMASFDLTVEWSLSKKREMS